MEQATLRIKESYHQSFILLAKFKFSTHILLPDTLAFGFIIIPTVKYWTHYLATYINLQDGLICFKFISSPSISYNVARSTIIIAQKIHH